MTQFVVKSFLGKQFSVVDPSTYRYTDGGYLFDFEFENESYLRDEFWSYIQPGENVIDMGASWGGWTLPALSQGAKVIAFEPSGIASSVLWRSVRANGWEDRFTLSGEFLSDRPSDLPEWFDTSVARPLAMDTTSATRLDDVMDRMGNPRISRIKIDIEGMEVPALNGSRRLLERDHPLLIIEDHVTTVVSGLSDNTGRLCSLLRSFGYIDVMVWNRPTEPGTNGNRAFVIARGQGDAARTKTMKTVSIPGPMGPFLIPAEPQNTREHATWISKMVWDGEYSHPDIPRSGIRSVLDIGSHCGSFAVLCQRQYGKNVAIDCYEPNPHACEMLKENAPGVRVHCVAVTSDPDPLYELPWDWGSAKTWGIKNAPAYGERFRVPALHPRDLPAADLLKCDAEGVEVEVMVNYGHFSGLKALIYEFHTLEHKATLAELVKARGFRCLREENEKPYGSSLWVPA